jgi:hypothetical protein
VEGNTEALYIKWLADVINKMQEADYRCSIPEPKLGLNLSKARRNISTGDYYFAIADRETYNDENKFKMLIEKLKPSEGERDITFEFGYSNISFELWLLLHKMDFAIPLAKQSSYLEYINKVFGTSFETLEKYKSEANFQKILSKLTIVDVKSAIKRAEKIQEKNVINGFQLQKYCGVEYFNENPSLSLHKIIEKILNECLG